MAEAAREIQQVNTKKGSRSRLILGIVVVMLLIVGGATGWYFMSTKSAATASAAKPASPIFMTLETFTVNLNGGSGDQYLQADISLQLTASSKESLLKQVMPQLKAAIVMILSSKSGSELSSVAGKSALALEIADAVNALLPDADTGKAVSNVFFTSFIIQ